jgi:putative DNA-invertase from lambdoid prophage Rac
MAQMTCAIWARVSTDDQFTENQLAVLRAWADSLGLTITAEYVTEDSAWRPDSPEFDKARAAMLAGVRLGKHRVVLCWRIDRLSRHGTEDMFRYLRLLAENGADVRSHEESWLNTADPFARDIMIGVMATLAKHQSDQRSMNIKAGMARARREGTKSGRPIGGRKLGAKDKKPRRTDGYKARWAREREAG